MRFTERMRSGERRWGAPFLALIVFSVLASGVLIEIVVSSEVSRAFAWLRVPVYGLGIHLIALLAYLLERLLVPSRFVRDERWRVVSYLALVHLGLALASLSAATSRVPSFLLAAFLILVRCLQFFALEKDEDLAPDDRRALWEMAGAWGAWTIAMLVYLFVFFEEGYQGLIWENADARHYYWLSNHLLTFDLEPEFFPIGLSLLLTPMNLIAGVFPSTDLGSLTRLNGFSLVFLAFVISPAAIVLLARTCIDVFVAGDRRSRRSWLPVAGVLILMVLAYAWWWQPHFISATDARDHPIMMFGLTPSVEPLNLLFCVLTLHYLSRVGRFGVVSAGLFFGMAVMVKETNAILAAVAIIFLWMAGERVLRLVALGGVAALIYCMQLLHNLRLHGSALAANRSYQWDQFAHRWTDYVRSHHGIAFLEGDPPRMSPAYVWANLDAVFSAYWLPLAVVVLAWLLLVRMYPAPIVTFALVAGGAFVLFHLGYVRTGAVFRYLHTVLPMAAVPVIGSLMIISRSRGTSLPPSSASRPSEHPGSLVDGADGQRPDR